MNRVVKQFLFLFKGLEHTHARQREDGTYYPISKPIRERDVLSHLAGKVTLGQYVVNVVDEVNYIVIDIDIEKGIADTPSVLKAVKKNARLQHEHLNEVGIPENYIENSGRRGYHIWIFFNEPIPAKYAYELAKKVVLNATGRITDNPGEFPHETFPKQTTIVGSKLGNLIKLPLGIHRKTITNQNPVGNSCVFVDPVNFNPIPNQYNYFVNEIKKISKTRIEKILGRKIERKIIDEDEIRRRISRSRKYSRGIRTYDIYPVGKDDPVLEIMLELVTGDVDKTPPCIREAYRRVTQEKGKFLERDVLVKYFSGKGYDPDQIAGFIRWHVNDAEDNEHPERLFMYVAWSYGDIMNKKLCYSCKSLIEHELLGLCINFNYKVPPVSTEYQKLMKIAEQRFVELRDEKRETIRMWEVQPEDKREELTGMNFDDLLGFTESIERDIKQAEQALIKVATKLNYNIQCTRFKSPLSHNGFGRDVNVLIDQYGKKKALPPGIKDKDDTGEQVFIRGEMKKLEPYDKYLPVKTKSLEMLRSSRKKNHPRVEVGDKPTRVGVTTSTNLETVRENLKTILVVPFNSIGRETFSNAVRISEHETAEGKFPKVVFGVVFGSNEKMCLKRMKKLATLRQKFNLSKGEEKKLAVMKLPFLTKDSCMTTDKNGNTRPCKYWKCIQVGTPKNERGEYIPVLESRMEEKIITPWCNILQTPTKLHNKCRLKSRFENEGKKVPERCELCNELNPTMEYVPPGRTDICAYATIFRHLINDVYGRTSTEAGMDGMPREDDVYLTREQINELKAEGYKITEVFEDASTGMIRVMISLRSFDTLVLTYQKFKALYKMKELQEEGGNDFGIRPNANLMLEKFKDFDVIMCDEVSRLVGQSPSSMNVYLKTYRHDESGSLKLETREEFDLLKKVEEDLDTIDHTNCPVRPSEKGREMFEHLREAWEYTMGNIRKWLIPRLTDSDMQVIRWDKEIPLELEQKILELQIRGYVQDESNNPINPIKREYIRYIDGISIKRHLDELASQIEDLQNNKRNMNHEEKISTNNQIRVLEEEYFEYFTRLMIKDDEIIITNYSPSGFSHGVRRPRDLGDYEHDRGILTFPTFNEPGGYKQGIFVAVQYILIENPIQDFFINRVGDDYIDEYFFEMYSFLERYASETNTTLDGLMKLLMIAMEEKFFADSSTTLGVHTSVNLQMEPGFVELCNFMNKFVTEYPVMKHGKVTYPKVLIATDATMPFISMSDVFGLPTYKWKFGDPQDACSKQIVISYSQTILTSDLLQFSRDKSIRVNKTKSEKEEKDPEDDVIYKAKFSNGNEITWDEFDDLVYGRTMGDIVNVVMKVANVIKNKSYKTRASKCVILRVNEDEYLLYDISNSLLLFQLIWLLNAACELANNYAERVGDPDDGIKQLFVIMPNKKLRDIFANFRTLGGMTIEVGLQTYLQKHHKSVWETCIEKEWIWVHHEEKRGRAKIPVYFMHVPNEELDIHWFRGDRTVGTASSHRIMVTVCDPSSPKGSLDWLANYYHSIGYLNPETNECFGLDLEDLGTTLRRMEIKSTYYQTISRVKDPDAEVHSVVLSWGLQGGKFNWARCSSCGVDEKHFYEHCEEGSYFDDSLGIESDGIYSFEDQRGQVKSLCYKCATNSSKNLTVRGYARDVRNRLVTDTTGVEDLLAFKVPVPHSYSPLQGKTGTVKNGRVIDLLLDERAMIRQARDWLFSEELPPIELIKICRILEQRSIRAGRRVALPIEKLRYKEKRGSRVDQKIRVRELRKIIKTFGHDKLKEINLERIRDEGRWKYRLKNMEYLNII